MPKLNPTCTLALALSFVPITLSLASFWLGQQRDNAGYGNDG
jgi:hypothetical protein